MPRRFAPDWYRSPPLYGNHDASTPVPSRRIEVPSPPPSHNGPIRAPQVTARYAMPVPMAAGFPTSFIRNPQKIVLKGERTLTRTQLEDNPNAVEEAIKEMIDNLEGYLYVTAPVLTWEGGHGGPVIHEGGNFEQDMIFLKIEGVGYLDAESDGADEVIEV